MNSTEKKCYRLVQEIVCERDRVCQRCGGDPVSGHHVFGRKNHGSCFESDSCLALCPSCHDGWARTCPQEARDLLKGEIGAERFTYLEAMSQEVCRLRDADYLAIAVELGKKLADMRGK